MFYRITISQWILVVFLVAECSLWSCRGNENGIPDNPTFAADIAPILYKNCAQCHRPEGVGPFALITYDQVLKKKKTINKVVTQRVMPPWPADPGYSHFIGENYLSDVEIKTIQRWIDQGCSKGDLAKIPAYKNPDYLSSIRKPDMVLYLDTVLLTPEMKDRFFLIKIPGHLLKDTFLQAVEFIAGQQDLVHHFNGHLLLYQQGAKTGLESSPLKVEITNGEYNSDFPKLNLLNNDHTQPRRIHSAVNYLPGVFGTSYPDGIGTIPITKDFAFVGNDMHYGPSDRYVTDRSRINLFFTSIPPKRMTGELMLGTNGVSKIEPELQIRPNTVSKHITRFRIDESISVLTINPHLHQLGKSFLAYALKPNGDTIRLIRIPNWDFRWQYFYTFPTMVPIPKGSTIVAEAVFDNTSNNPSNPFSPPRLIGERKEYGGASMRASDEMFQFIITYTDYKPGDEKVSLRNK